MGNIQQGVESVMWVKDFTFDDFPKGKHVDIKVIGKGGKEKTVQKFVPEYFIARTMCGQNIYTYVMESGRLHMMATGEMPLGFMKIPEWRV